MYMFTKANQPSRGPLSYYECQSAIIGAATTNERYGGFDTIIRKAALFMELFDYYQLPELTITMTNTTIAIRRTPMQHISEITPALIGIITNGEWHTTGTHHFCPWCQRYLNNHVYSCPHCELVL